MSHIRLFNHYMPTPLLLLGCIEWLAMLLAVPIAVQLRFDAPMQWLDWTILELNAVIFATVMTLANSAMGVYSNGFREGLGAMAVRTIVANCLLGVLALTALYYVLPALFIGRGILAIAVVAGLTLVSIIRLIFLAIVQRDSMRSRILVVGAGKRANVLKERLAERESAAKIVGFVDVGGYVHPDLEKLVLPRSRLRDIVEANDVDDVVVAMDGLRASDGVQIPLKELFDCKVSGTRINEAIGIYERELGILEFTELKQGWMVFGNGFGASRLWDWVKRASDLTIALILCLFLWPLMLFAVVAILLETGRPVLYRQTRVGLNGTEFEILKFRSMRVDAEAGGKAQFAQVGDSRITKVGNFIRNTRIDELPQLYNVLKGDMSFVGPRPERPEFVSGFDEELPFYAERHVVKPGLMGWAQLNYPYGASKEDTANKLRYDLYYVKNRSLVLDLVIMVQTVQVILLGTGVR